MLPLLLPLLLLPTLTLATNLYVASYAGNISTLSLLLNPDCESNSNSNSNNYNSYCYNLTQTSTFNTSTHTPSWLTLDRHDALLYMVDEAVNNTNGTIVAYRTGWSGRLEEVARTEDVGGGVHAAFFADGKGLVVPH